MDERGQSVFDFSIGASLFLVVVLGVLVFLPTAFGAINDSGAVTDSDRRAAERAADYLADTAFSNASTPVSEPRTFQVTCVNAFFNDTDACGFESGNPWLATDAGLPKQRPLNVTVEADRDAGTPLCWDAGTNALVNASSTDCDPTTGPDVPFRGASNGSNAALNQEFATATRAGRVAGEDVYVVVRTW